MRGRRRSVAALRAPQPAARLGYRADQRQRGPGTDRCRTEPTTAPGAARWAPDEQIVAALRAGDERTFRELFQRHYSAMKRAARGYVESDAVAEEIVQETWLAILTGIDRFEGRSALGTWMFSILINQAKSHSTRERRTLPFSSMSSSRGDEPAVDADRFQKDDEAWPGHWATPPRPWQKPDRRALSLEARELVQGGSLGIARSPAPDRRSARRRRALLR